MERFARIAVRNVPYAADKPYTYRIPSALADGVIPGVRVTVPFGQGNRRQEGFVLRLTGEAGRDGIKNIETVLDTEPVLDEGQIKLALWMRERFYCTVYEAARAMLPSGLWYRWDEEARDGAPPRRRAQDKTALRAELAVSSEEAASYNAGRSAPAQKEVLSLLRDVGSASAREIRYLTGTGRRTLNALEAKGLITLFEEPVYTAPAVTARAEPIVLNEEQEAAFGRCREALDTRKPACGLLYGVTGSGKTNVYIRLTERVLDEGGGALVLVPEIALTPQLMSLFSAHFGSRAALLHSALSMGERLNEWKRIREGLASVVLGTRSAVFAPVRNLRLIVLDEEQEGSYKSENAPRYHAREVAKYRCVRQGATLLLGSATPSVESFSAAEEGSAFLCRMKARYNRRALPEVRIVSLSEERKVGNDTTISQALHGEITYNLAHGEQTVLLLNRRGHHKSMICPACGASPGCPRCSVPLAYHSANHRLMCHYCGYSQKFSGVCAECGAQLIPLGAGTQRVAEDLERLFPGAEVLRMDADTTGSRGAHERILDRFRKRKVPFLVGTQMVAKGLDFPDVTLAGVLCADAALYMDDFRANERSFSLMTQVIGRAGRGGKPGRAVIQTYAPDHPVILAAAAQDYDRFYEGEAALRRVQGYPPFGSLTQLTFFSMNQDDVMQAGLRVKGWIDAAKCEGVSRALGPAPDRVARLNMRYRCHIILIHNGSAAVRRLVSGVLTAFPADKKNKGVFVFADGQP
ncbi:MAG: primosomal protein N' [Oscillospiraceae bacterium]|jgi:primosomal protein N' (replication factor Y)|nr:primosomal protein N' [Oscillospiraceae bacterium]